MGKLVVLAALAALVPGAVRAQEPDVTMYRSWRPPNVTVVEGLFRVDRALAGPACEYEVQLTVTDSTGTPLVRNDWAGRCPAPGGGIEAGALETFQFAVVPARYRVQLSVQPKGSPQERRTRTIDLVAAAAPPVVSDLVLARRVAFVAAADTQQWTLRRGDIGIAAASRVVAEPDHASIGYYLEVYPDSGETLNGVLHGIVRRRADRRELHRVQLQRIDTLREPRPLAGNMSVAGLPPGEYTLEARLELADTVIRREHPFDMAAAAVADATPQRTGWFWTLSEQQLAELFDAVVLWLESEAERNLYTSLNGDGRREFLSRQFGREEPTPGDGVNSALDEYLARIAAVNARFAERGGRPAWQTDRGRIYMQRGEPTNTLSRPAPADGVPYEAWSYPIGPGYHYVFGDETRIGNYRLLYTNDPGHVSRPDWIRLLGAAALEDLQRFGVRLRGGG